ncbi:hypothetical protein [Acinetobacter larvae]|uniref:DUF697 domain-containing protein n=1 Tax=Acinetobacter larvae TaxID=1789224 RepID=A0A1B2LWA2_9GAMM|nr:hypothetical protein [Acinetobacter larvae]AOA57169.1 hypothetical protein BFG52_01575 [Acinetobacter larvae]
MKIDNISKSIDPSLNLEQVRQDCLDMVQKRSYISAGVAVVPIPFFDVLIDVSMLSQLIPEINSRFGLAPEQVSVYDPETKKVHWNELRKRGIEFSGFILARTAIKKSINNFVTKMLAKQVTKFVPLGGQAVAAGMGYAVMKKIASAHVEDCYKLAKDIQNKQFKQTVAHPAVAHQDPTQKQS